MLLRILLIRFMIEDAVLRGGHFPTHRVAAPGSLGLLENDHDYQRVQRDDLHKKMPSICLLFDLVYCLSTWYKVPGILA